MLHHEALLQLTHDRQHKRRREAENERLALQARGRRHRRRQRLTLEAALGLLRHRGAAQGYGG